MTSEIIVELCGRLADPYGPTLRIAIPDEGCRVSEMRHAIARGWPDLAAAITDPRIRACIDELVVADERALINPRSTLAFFPPVSGG